MFAVAVSIVDEDCRDWLSDCVLSAVKSLSKERALEKERITVHTRVVGITGVQVSVVKVLKRELF
jgi:hypothetical protein